MAELGIILNAFHYFFNRLLVIPAGYIVGFGWWSAFFMALITDIIQMFIYSYFLEGAGVNKKAGYLISKWFPSKDKVERTKIVIRLRRFGYVGIMILAALPIYAGGMYSAVLVSHLMRLKRKKSYLFLTIGSIMGSAILTIGLKAIWEYIIT